MAKNSKRQRHPGEGSFSSTRTRAPDVNSLSRLAARESTPAQVNWLKGDGEFRTPRAEVPFSARGVRSWLLSRFLLSLRPAPRAMRRGATLYTGTRDFARAYSLQSWRGVAYCARRKVRRQVLFAMRRAGFRGSAPKKHYRRVLSSAWRC